MGQVSAPNKLQITLFRPITTPESRFLAGQEASDLSRTFDEHNVRGDMAMQCIRSSPQQHVTSYMLQATTQF